MNYFVLSEIRRYTSFLISVAVQSLKDLCCLRGVSQPVQTLGRTPWASDQPVARPLPTQHGKTTDIRAVSGIRTHDPGLRVIKACAPHKARPLGSAVRALCRQIHKLETKIKYHVLLYDRQECSDTDEATE
jgi:hypothetical protein